MRFNLTEKRTADQIAIRSQLNDSEVGDNAISSDSRSLESLK